MHLGSRRSKCNRCDTCVATSTTTELLSNPLRACSRRRLRFGDKPHVRPLPGRLLSPLPPAAPPPLPQQQQKQQEAGLTGLVTRLLQRWHQVSRRLQDNWGRLLYDYFNWRQDNTAKDLLLIFALFFSFVMLGSCTHRWVIDNPDERGMGGLWNDVYQASACRMRRCRPCCRCTYAPQHLVVHDTCTALHPRCMMSL